MVIISESLVVKDSVDLFKQLEDVVDLECALKFLKKVELLKVVLKQEKIFEQNSVNYAKLHMEALIKVVELGGEDQLSRSGYKKRTAVWAANLDDDERLDVIKLIEQGLSIEQIYKREVVEKENEEKRTNKLNRLREKVLDECENNGVVDLEDYKNEVYQITNDEDLALDIIDGTRGALRRMGAVGVQPRSDLYVLPTAENGWYVEKALITRIESVCKDILRIKALVEQTNIKLDFNRVYSTVQDLWDSKLHYFDRGMKGTTWAATHGGQNYLVFLMLLLAEIGVVDGNDDFYSDVIIGIHEQSDELLNSYQVSKSTAYYWVMQDLKKALEKTKGKDLESRTEE